MERGKDQEREIRKTVQTGYMGNENDGDIGDKELARSGTSGRDIGESSS
jgi:hypothetical protein